MTSVKSCTLPLSVKQMKILNDDSMGVVYIEVLFRSMFDRSANSTTLRRDPPGKSSQLSYTQPQGLDYSLLMCLVTNHDLSYTYDKC